MLPSVRGFAISSYGHFFYKYPYLMLYLIYFTPLTYQYHKKSKKKTKTKKKKYLQLNMLSGAAYHATINCQKQAGICRLGTRFVLPCDTMILSSSDLAFFSFLPFDLIIYTVFIHGAVSKK